MRRRTTVKVIMRAFDEQRPNASVETRKNIKAGLEKFLGKKKRGGRRP